MDYSAGSSLFPLHRCKTIHLVGNIHSPLFNSPHTQHNYLIRINHCFVHSPILLQVRHAQGIHNVEGDKNYNAYINPDYFDAHLTPLGWQQVYLFKLLNNITTFFFNFFYLFSYNSSFLSIVPL